MSTTPPSGECCNSPEIAGELYALDHSLPLGERFNALARFRGGSWTVTRWLTHLVPPRLAAYALNRLRTQPDSVLGSGTPFLLSLTHEALREGLRILVAEWMEFRRVSPTVPLDLVVRARPDARESAFDFVSRYWDQVQGLKRQLAVPRSGIYLWLRDEDDSGDEALLQACRALVVVARGQSFADPLSLAREAGKPAIAPRGGDVPDDYPFAFTSRPAVLRFLGEPRRRSTSSMPWPIPEPFEVAKAIGRFVTAEEKMLAAAARQLRGPHSHAEPAQEQSVFSPAR
jgi:hypothetical protein